MAIDGRALRARRRALGITQKALAELSGVHQPTIAAVETGRRAASEDVELRLVAALRARPRRILLNLRDEVVAKVAEYGGRDVKVFGSVARGSDTEYSDIDLLASFDERFDVMAKFRLVDELRELLTVPVDVVADSGGAAVTARARREAVVL